MDSLAVTDQSEKPLQKASNTSVKPLNRSQGDDGKVATPILMKGQVIQKNYVLNDSGALKKKLRHETREDAFNLGVEARDGSNMVVELKTSFFEHVKSNFVNDLHLMNEIVTIDNAVASKATTENSGGAFVEYSLDITFKSQDIAYMTKLTAYTTSCRIMFQPVGGSSQAINPFPGTLLIPSFFHGV